MCVMYFDSFIRDAMAADALHVSPVFVIRMACVFTFISFMIFTMSRTMPTPARASVSTDAINTNKVSSSRCRCTVKCDDDDDDDDDNGSVGGTVYPRCTRSERSVA